MTKEQIIIDGVEVLKEKINMCFILLLNKLETPETIEQTIYEHLDAFVQEWNTQLARKTPECESLKQEIEILQNNFDTATRDCNEIVAELENECEQLKKANLHIDTNRQCKGKKLKRIEELISACEAGYTDEFIQKIYGIIQESEPAIDDYSITDRYRKALVEIELTIKNLEKGDILTFPDFTLQENATMIINQCNQGYRDILDIISRAKGS